MIKLFHLLRVLIVGAEVGEPMCSRNGVARSLTSRSWFCGRLFWLNFLCSTRTAGLCFSDLLYILLISVVLFDRSAGMSCFMKHERLPLVFDSGNVPQLTVQSLPM